MDSLVIQKLTYAMDIRGGFLVIARSKLLFIIFITFYFASFFLMLIANAGVVYVSDCWSGTRKKVSGKYLYLQQ